MISWNMGSRVHAKKVRVKVSVDSTSSTLASSATAIVRKPPCHRGEICNSLKGKDECLVNFCPSSKNTFSAQELGVAMTKDSQVFPQYLWKTIGKLVGYPDVR
jgi:hypothetical protein